MKKLELLFLAILAAATFTFTACSDDDSDGGDTDPCADVVCGEGEICAGGLCIPDPNDTRTIFDTTTFTKECDDVDETFTIVRITDRGEGIGSITLSNEIVYILNSRVFVNDGQTLTIEAGTIIKGASGQGEDAKALIVARGGTIEANGTADDPIIFTAEADDIFRNANGYCGGDKIGSLSATTRGLWGGVIILGSASLNTDPAEQQIEGIPTSEPRGLYGGSDDSDNSGTFRYASIRYGGTDIGAGNEINGLTMGGVGNGTTIEYVEVFGNKDDGFEWFGGTVNTKYLVSAYNADDAVDYDQGWRGNNQFWLIFQANESDRGGEHDGGTSPETGEPYANPVISNATFVGIDGAGTRTITFRDNAGGQYYNSIFLNYDNGVDVENLPPSDPDNGMIEDSHEQLVAGNLIFANNIMFNIDSEPFLPSDDTDADALMQVRDHFTDNDNLDLDVMDPSPVDAFRPANDALSSARTDMEAIDGFFENVNYKGGVNATGDLWVAGWTRLSAEL